MRWPTTAVHRVQAGLLPSKSSRHRHTAESVFGWLGTDIYRRRAVWPRSGPTVRRAGDRGDVVASGAIGASTACRYSRRYHSQVT